MFKALIITKNCFLALGVMSSLPEDVTQYDNVSYAKDKYIEDISIYDLIIMEVSHNQIGLCIELLKKRKSDSNLIFIQTGRQGIEKERFLFCYKDAVIVLKNTNISVLKKLIASTIKKKNGQFFKSENMCDDCPYPYLTGTQFLILAGLKNEFSVKELAFTLRVDPKTVYSQLDKIRDKFNLISCRDMHYFLHYALICSGPIVLR